MSQKKAVILISFFKNPWNVIFTLACFGLIGYAAYGLLGGPERYLLTTETRTGRDMPPQSEIEAFYRDNAGSLPVDEGFDSDPDEICGNGKSYYWTSKPPQKPIPSSWEPPPRPGSDPDYEGPDPLAEFKESPYAMPSSKAVLTRHPIRNLDESGLTKAVQKAAGEIKGRIAYVGKTDALLSFAGIESRIVPINSAQFDIDDDEVIAKKLLRQNFELVLVDRTVPAVMPWMEERMDSVRIRLRDAVSLDWFHPLVLGSGFALYRVKAPLDISSAVKLRITSRIRSLLTGREPVEFEYDSSADPGGDDIFRVIVSLRRRAEPKLKGRKVTKEMAHGKTLLEAIDNAVSDIKEEYPDIRKRMARIYGFMLPAEIADAVAQMEIEVDVLYDMCILTDRNIRNLIWYLELGLEGASLRGNDTLYYLEPSYAVHMEMTSEVRFLERFFMKSGLDMFLRESKKRPGRRVMHVSKWEKDTTFEFGRFRTVNWIEEQGSDSIVELYRGVPLKTIWDVRRESLVRSLILGAKWLTFNQKKDGQYAYKYKPINIPGKRWTPGANIVRHALNPYTLLMVNKIKPDPGYVQSAKRGIAFTLKFLRRKGDRCVICHRDTPARYYNAKIGTNAVTILSILKLGDVADISEYDDVVRCLAQEILHMQDPNGHYWQYDVPPDHPYYGAESTIAPGEFIFALARMYRHYGDEAYRESVDRALPFYMKAWRARRRNRTKQGIYDEEHRVNLIGIVPWLVTALNDLHMMTRESHYADVAFEMQDWIDREFFWYTNRAQYPDYVGASFKVHRELPAINSCQYTEGAAAAYDLAKRTGRNIDLRRRVVVLGMRFCLQLQYDSYASTFFLPVPEEAMGGYRYTLGHARLRNDYNYHAMAAIAQAVDYLEPDDYPSETPVHVPPVIDELLGGRKE